MSSRSIKTPLHAAFFCIPLLVACDVDQAPQRNQALQCSSSTTPIAKVQGTRTESDLAGQQVSVKGVVTLLEKNRGLYIEEPDSDGDEHSSDAIFLATPDWPGDVTSGSMIHTSGRVAEIGDGRYTMTAITDIDGLVVCGSNQPLPISRVSLPLNGYRREAIEGMRIAITNPLTVTDVYRLQAGNITVSGNGKQYVPTEISAPGRDAAEHMDRNRAFALPAHLAGDLDAPELVTGGTELKNAVGVLGHDGYDLRISLQAASFQSAGDALIPKPATPAALRVTGMNLHNYFNGDGKGQGFPTPRGAETLEEFNQQRERIGAAIKVLDPHIIAVQELENDGFGQYSAARDLIKLANSATGANWVASRPTGDNTGDDAITVGLLYRTDRVKATGDAETLTGPEFSKSRQPMAQVFQAVSGGEPFLVVVNHFKSKGSCPDSGENANQHDGQACWNPMRLATASKVSAWAQRRADYHDTENILIMGDLNAYRMEDPIAAIRQAGFTELMDNAQEPVYSFVYRGQHGSLDYAFVSESLLDQVNNAFIWNVNATYPTRQDLPQSWMRFSDHDPVVVDILPRQPSTSD